MILAFYQITIQALTPILKILVFFKARKYFKNSQDRLVYYNQRTGKLNIHNQRPTIWFHMVSAGETMSVIPLIKELFKIYPDQLFLITTTTPAGKLLIEQNLKAYQPQWLHHYIPLDVAGWMKNFINHWDPKLAIFVESELWPTTLTLLKRRRAGLILLNARLSTRSFKRWQIIPTFAQKLLSQFDLILAQSRETYDHINKLMKPQDCKQLKFVGNLKLTANQLPSNQIEVDKCKEFIGARAHWIAASTHNPEELMVGQVHLNLKKLIPQLLTILVPRHPIRAAKIRTQLEEMGLTCAQRSLNEEINNNIDIYIADTLGELGVFYSLACPVFIGGSFAPIGGHNPLEPAFFKCPVLWGPHMFNFKETTEILSDHAIEIAGESDLVKALHKLIMIQPDMCQEIGQKLYDICMDKKQSILADTVHVITDKIDSCQNATES